MRKLSIGIIALNEERFLPRLLNDLVEQTYNHSMMEILLIDGGSTDNTKSIMLLFQKNNPGNFNNILVLDNPKKIQAAGWNIAIKNYTGESLTRIDAHSNIDKDFCKYVAMDLSNGENVVGGKRPCLIEKNTKWANALLQIENSLFGSSFLNSRSSNKCQYVKTMFHATYKREVLNQVGFFNEKLLRTEDNEFHYRVSKAGYKLYYDPSILSYQYMRANFKKMAKQKYSNGFWIGKTLKICPGCISLYHMIPFFFIFGIVITTIIAFLGYWHLAATMWGLYFLFGLTNTIISGKQGGFSYYHIIMPFLYLFLHINYGIGTLCGLLSSK